MTKARTKTTRRTTKERKLGARVKGNQRNAAQDGTVERMVDEFNGTRRPPRDSKP